MKDVYLAYSDESGIFTERYQSIGVVSGTKESLSLLRTKLKEILIENNITEVKFSEIRTHAPRIKAARGFIEKGIKFAKRNEIRLDILSWDMHDTRHTISGRDDIGNLERMYYKMLRHISERWKQLYWEFYPDENSTVDWRELISYLNKTKIPRYKPNILKLFKEERYDIKFAKIKEIKSHHEPLIQLADLFAGISCFSRENGEDCIRWLGQQNIRMKKLPFFSRRKEQSPIESNCNRFKLIGKLNNLCKKYSLGVSLNTKKYLWTPDPSSPVNFWNYEPKCEEDKAPTKH